MTRAKTIKTPRGWCVLVTEFNELSCALSAVAVFSNGHSEHYEYYDCDLLELEQQLIAGETVCQRNKMDAPFEPKISTPPPRGEEETQRGRVSTP